MSDELKAKLTQPVTHQEIKEAVKQASSDSVPGPDGFT